MPDWYAADQAYLAHHANCAECRAAGARPGQLQRCPTGLELWDNYNQAGTPPHLLPRARQKEAAQ